MQLMGTELLELDELDRRILHALQYDFAIVARPYQAIAAKLDTTEEAVLERAADLNAKGLIRRLGASINSRRIGYCSILVALKVDDEFLTDVADAINGFSGVTHNYLRDGEYNMWFTVIAPNQESLDRTLNSIADLAGVEEMLPLPAKQVFKVSVKFPIPAGVSQYDRLGTHNHQGIAK